MGRDEIDPHDLEICQEIEKKMKEGNLVLGMVSGTVFPRTDPDIVTMAVIDWCAKPACPGIAGIDACRCKAWLCYEPGVMADEYTSIANKSWDRWVSRGGLHVDRQWHGPNKANETPSDWMKVEDKKGQLWAFSHFYNRWVQLVEAQYYQNMGFLLEKDFRKASVFAMLEALAYSNPGFPEVGQRQNLLKALEVEKLHSEFSLYSYSHP